MSEYPKHKNHCGDCCDFEKHYETAQQCRDDGGCELYHIYQAKVESTAEAWKRVVEDLRLKATKMKGDIIKDCSENNHWLASAHNDILKDQIEIIENTADEYEAKLKEIENI